MCKAEWLESSILIVITYYFSSILDFCCATSPASLKHKNAKAYKQQDHPKKTAHQTCGLFGLLFLLVAVCQTVCQSVKKIVRKSLKQIVQRPTVFSPHTRFIHQNTGKHGMMALMYLWNQTDFGRVRLEVTRTPPTSPLKPHFRRKKAGRVVCWWAVMWGCHIITKTKN